MSEDLDLPAQEPAAPEPEPEPEPEPDPSARAASLETELAAIRAAALAGEMIRVKVEPPHSAMVLGGITVGSEWTEVPARFVPALVEGAANAGVTITQES